MKFRMLIAAFMALAFMGALVSPNAALAKRTKSQAELDAAKKEGDLSPEAAKKAQEAYLQEGEAANVAGWDHTKGAGSGHSTYGVVGFDYLTGVGKVASDPSKIGADLPAALGGGKITQAFKTPLQASMAKRFTNKWTGQLGDTESGWAEKSGVTEVWFRSVNSGSKLGGDYNQWVNQWNNITRPNHGKGEFKTPIPGSDPDQGAHWFSVYCVHCHGWTGKGDGPTAAELDPRPRNLTNGKYANYINNLEIFKVIKGGGEARNLSAAMPPWGNIMQDQDIWNTVAFIRTLAANPKYELDPDDVTAANAGSNKEYAAMNEELELEGVMAGRGGKIVGGYNSIGGGRLASKKVGVATQATSGASEEAKVGDWAETQQYDK